MLRFTKKLRFPVLFVLLCSVCLLVSFNVREDSRDDILKRIKAPEFPYKAIPISYFRSSSSGGTDWKPAFDKAMAWCKKKGGGRILVPAGNYPVKGPIHFTSNTELHLDSGAVLVFSAEPKHYLPVVKTSWEGTFLYNYSPFIYGYQLKNIAITGRGTIMGEPTDTWAKWHDDFQKKAQLASRDMNHQRVPIEKRIFGEGHFLRPQFIQFYECQNILIEDVLIENSPFWCIHPLLCRNVTIRGVRFNAHNYNNDGVDPEFSEDVLIEDVTFNNADDNVAIKAGRDHDGRELQSGSKNIIIRNCRFMGLHAVVIGSEMSAGVSNVFIDSCGFAGKVKRGIYLKSNADRGGFISNIFASNVQFGEAEDCIMITSKYKNEGQGYFTDIHDIYLKNISCRKATGYGIIVEGFPEKRVENLVMSDIVIDTANIPVSITGAGKVSMDNIRIGAGK